MNANRFIKLIFIFTLGFFFLEIIFNYIINPYKVFNNSFIKNDTSKLSLNNYRITKFYSAKRVNPNILMVGSSRIAHLNPQDLQKYVNGKIYNLGLHGSGIMEQYYNIKYFVENYDITTIILGTDFASYNKYINESDSTYNQKSGFKIERFNFFYYKDYVDSLLGINALKNSITFLNTLDTPLDFNVTNGFDNRNDRYDEIKRIGFDEAFKFRSNASIEEYKNNKYLYNSEEFKSPKSIDKYITYLDKIVKLCKKKNILLKTYISPIYYKQNDLIYEKNLGKTFEYWKKEVSRITKVYDFNNFKELVKNKNFFLDSSHAKSIVGKYIFAKIFDDSNISIVDILNKTKKHYNYSSKPILIKSINKINIVHYEDLYYAIPQHLGKIDLEKDNIKNTEGIIIDKSLSNLMTTLGLEK